MYKYEKIKKETNKKLKEILTNKNEFINFIKFYSKFYKYKFQDTLCIYVQNENATAVAEYDTWQRIKFQVKKGEKGIGLFDDSKSKLRYVFDISSTYQQKIKLWEYIEDRHKNILNLDFSKNKFIEKYSIENIEDESIKNLIYYMNKLAKNTRLGIETENFEKIVEIVEKTLPKIQLKDIDIFFNQLCSSVSKDLLEIENTIKSYERNLLKEKEQENVPFSNDKNDENISIESKKEYIKQYFGKVILVDNKEYIIKDFFDELDKVDLVDIDGTMRFNYGELYSQKYEKIDHIYNLLQDKNNIVNYDLKTKYNKKNIKKIFDEVVDIKQNKNQITTENTTITNETKKNIELEKETMIEYINSNIDREINFKGNKVEIQGFDENLDKVILFNPNNILVSDDDLVDIEEIYYFLKEEDKKLSNEQEKEQTYNTGDTIILEEMVGENLPNGLKGTIRKIDDIGQIHVSWENGSSLAIDPKIDKFEVLQKQVEKTIEEQKEEEKSTSSFFIPSSENYDLSKKKIPYPTTTTEKIQANINAIKTLLTIESENRLARAEEKEILANYVGWGGLPQLFENSEDIQSIVIREKAIELKELLTDEEYNSAKASTLNAHYTPNEIIQNMYVAIKNFGYNNNVKILEPSCGIGNFIGNLPKELMKSKITGVELDSITGRIARQLYPTANIKINGFEKEFFKENDVDLVVGNVPFGNYSIYDKKYNKNNYLIHDYFINKSLELTKPNGIVALITSKGTLDKKDNAFRKELSKKVELVGAIRLPNTAFKHLAGTEVVCDILFFQKLEKEREEIPYWVDTSELKYENRINNYFINNPEMILGQLDYKSNRYGRFDLTVNFTGENLQESLKEAIEKLPKNIVNQENLSIYTEDILEEKNIESEIEELLNNTKYKSFRYIYYNDKIFYKHHNDSIEKIEIPKNRNRLIGMINLRNLSKELIDIQLDKYSDESIFEEKLQQFNDYYDEFVDKYGYINNKTNLSIFKDDDDVHFLSSLEKADKEKYIKGDFFYKRTVAPVIEIKSVDNAKDGLILSLNKFADIDFNYIQSLYNKPTNQIIDELIENDLIYLNPLKYQQDDITKGWEIKSVYLNENVKEKLRVAESLKDESPYFERNIEKLKEVIPKDIEFLDIKIDMGSDLYKTEDMKAFAKELLNLSLEPDIKYNIKTAEWRIYNKGVYGYLAKEEYGTKRMGALYILEKMLNNQEVVVKDEMINDTKRFVTNKDETIKVNEKKILIERAFDDFIHRNKDIRDRIEKEYNERFNNSINSNWDIELKLPNLAQDISLRPHQKRAVARSIFSPNNLLLDHQVGAGKTFIMIVSAMEKKRLGIANKPLLVVPNNITGQFKNDFYKLYPTANILYADEKSFETKNRKRFLSKIAQNDYDAIIMGQSQFDLLKISKERQIDSIRNQIYEIEYEMKDLDKGEDRLSIKILERTKKSLEKNLEKLIDSPTETILDFEQLGIDALYIDEAHLYKNLYFATKLRNVAGINQTNSQKAFNLKMKIEYLEEIGAKITFATGTPISNTMAEMYTMQRFLASEKLEEQGIYSFDAWQKIYANTETKLEISPAGNGFQTKTRFSNFKNIPELMNFYNSFADVVTTEMINLPIPKYENCVIEAETSEELAMEMESFGERADYCKGGRVNPKEDNILKIVHEGRYAGLDIRHINKNYPDYENSKVNMLVNKVFEIYEETSANKSTQVIFSDLSTPKKDEFNIYDDIKEKLINKGIKEEEIDFVHSAKNSKEREKLFEKVRTGEIRVILGSTSKMGAGTNFQDKLIALYHLDTPWRPSDLEQREGRILRQGNENEEVKIFRCITKGSFDAYSWQILEQKQRFIAQAKTGAITGREVKDIDEVSIDYAEIKALATGNPLIKRKMEIDTEIEKLKILETAYRKQLYNNQSFLEEEYPVKIEKLNNKLNNIKEDLKYCETINFDENQFNIIINNNSYADKEVAGELLIKLANSKNKDEKLGEYKGFMIYSDSMPLNSKVKLCRNASYSFNLNNGYKKGNIDLLDNAINEINEDLSFYEKRISDLENKKELIQGSLQREFENKETLLELYKEKAEIEKSFDDENKTAVNFEYEEIEEIEQQIYEDEIEL